MAINTVNKSKLKTFWGWEVQTENLNNVDYLTYTYYINLVAAIMRQQKIFLTWRELSALAISHHVKVTIREEILAGRNLTGRNFGGFGGI